tara:strand:+ start:9363 stop:9959 length:597 start_codon:yes stop_codon:yes gene_type:complete
MKEDLLTYILIGLIVIICIKLYVESDNFQLKCIISDVDGNKYCVRERAKLELVADQLALTTNNMKAVVKKCKEEYGDKKNVKRLIDGFNPKKIYEILPTSEYTAYSENKGEKIAFCVETEKENGKGNLVDLNTLTYVALHELAHVMTESIGHTKEFWDNYKFLLEVAASINIYNPIDYKKKPVRYCGMNITDNPYFDK